MALSTWNAWIAAIAAAAAATSGCATGAGTARLDGQTPVVPTDAGPGTDAATAPWLDAAMEGARDAGAPIADAAALYDSAAPTIDGASGSTPIDAGSPPITIDAGTPPIPTDAGGLALVACDDEPVVRYASSGLPLVESNPGAPVALFLDFDGGEYCSSSSGCTTYGSYSRDSSRASFSAAEKADVLLAWRRVAQYYAMFDVNVTTDDEARRDADGWGWILITEDASGGTASTSSNAIGTATYARALVGSSTARSEDSDKARRIAHELGHNFTLEHSGVWDGGEFFKWEDWDDWDRVYGPIMGGGGYGARNGWAHGHHEDDPTSLQDDMTLVRARITAIAGAGDGWRVDDFPGATPTALCDAGGGAAYRHGVLGRPDDVDVFELRWAGGPMMVEATAPDVSAALLEIDVLRAGSVVAHEGTTTLAAGTYQIRVASNGDYGAIGEYELHVE